MKSYTFLLMGMPFVLAGCASVEGIDKRWQGGALGGLTGATACKLAKANDTECALLVAGGATVGYGIGAHLDRRDQEAYAQAKYQVLEEGRTSSTKVSTQTNHSVTVKSQEDGTYVDASGRTCKAINIDYRKSTQSIQEQETYCKDSNGTWSPIT